MPRDSVGGTLAFGLALAPAVVFCKLKKHSQLHHQVFSETFKQAVRKNINLTKALILIAFPNLLQILLLEKAFELKILPNWIIQLACIKGSLLFLFIH